MKQALRILPVFLACVLLAGCAPPPRAVAKQFLDNIAKGKLSEAKKQATDQTGQMLDLMASLGKMPVDPDVRFTLVDEKVDGNKATVRFKVSNSDDISVVELVRLDGQWKVHTEAKK